MYMEEKLRKIWNLAVKNINEDTKYMKKDYGIDVNGKIIYFEVVSTSEIFYYSQDYELHGLVCAKEIPKNTRKKDIKVLNTFNEFKYEIEKIAKNLHKK